MLQVEEIQTIPPLQTTTKVKIPIALLVINGFATVFAVLSFEELFPKYDGPPWLIPADALWPVFMIAAVIVIVTTGFMLWILVKHKKGSAATDHGEAKSLK